MQIKVAGYVLDTFESIDVNLKFDAIASTFRATCLFDPTNSVHRKIFKPGAFHQCVISHAGVTLLTGRVIGVQFTSAGDPPKHLVHIGGYSMTGVLEDCVSARTPAENTDLSLKEIAEATCGHYFIKVIIDPEVAAQCDTTFTNPTPKIDEPIKAFLDRLASHVNVVVSHDAFGNLLLTKAKVDKLLTTSSTAIKSNPAAVDSYLEGADPFTRYPTIQQDRAILYNFNGKTPSTTMLLNFNGQQIHSDILVCSQYGGQNNGGNDLLYNPYFTDDQFYLNYNEYMTRQLQVAVVQRGQRPLTVVQQEQTDESDNAAPRTARAVLGDEVKNAVRLMIDTDRIALNGNIITPNQLITAQSDELYLFKPTKFFIQEVVLSERPASQTAHLMCVPPDAFGTDPVKNIFE